MHKSNSYLYEFGEFRLDLVKRELRREGELVAVTPKIFDTLRVLVQHQGEVVTKNLLMDEIWGDAFVEESGLMRNVSVLRKTLGEQSVPFIVTVPGKGYRFVAEVREVPEEDALIIDEQTRGKIVIEEKSDFRSLAVLPFKTLGTAEENQYLALGMADALIIKLSNLKKLRVRPTSAVIKYGGLEQNPFKAGRELRVESVIEGNIWQLNERLRITVQLVNVADEVSLWADKFDEPLTDIFAIHDSISERVASALEFQLTGHERQQLTKRETESLTAYQLYSQGLYHFNHFSPQNIYLAISCFEQAVKTDPNYALAYAMLFGSQMTLAVLNLVPLSAISDGLRPLAVKAMELDPTLPAAHYASGFASFFLDWDLKEAEKSFQRAIELNPNDVMSNKHFSIYLYLTGRFAEALEFTQIAFELDPLAADLASNVGHTFYFAGRYDEAIRWHRKALEIDPHFVLAQVGLAFAFAYKKMFAEAFSAFAQVPPVLRNEPTIIAAQAFLSALAGDQKQAREDLEKLSQFARQRYVSPFETAAVYAGLEDSAEAFAWLDKAFDERCFGLVSLKVDPRFNFLRKDPRFDNLLERIGFPIK